MLSKNQIKLIKSLETKKNRKREGLFVAEGPKVVGDLLRAGYTPHSIFSTHASPITHNGPHSNFQVREHPTPILITDDELRRISFLQHPQEVLGVFHIPMPSHPIDISPQTTSLSLALDGVQDPGNVGTMIRTALSFQYSGFMLSLDSCSLYNSKVVQSSKGALFHLPIARGELSELKERGYHIFLTTLDGIDEATLDHLPKPFVLVFGNEGQGVSKKNMDLGEKLRIEMSGIDSLNVAIAAGIFMYRFRH
jgi:TrmH family RNA methyltransferase